MSEQYLQLEGANICYEVKGNGPCIVFMAGGDGGYKPFRPLRNILVKHFTVVLYNRRGHYKSKLTGAQDYSKRIETDVEDLYRIMKNITDKPFSLFASSSSGIVALTYLNTHPSTVSKCFLHEPMLELSALPNGKESQDFHREGYGIYKKYGRDATLIHFGNKYLNELDYHFMVERQLEQDRSGWDYHFEHETRQYPFIKIDMKKSNSNKNKLVLLYGIKSVENFVHLPVAAFSKALDKDMLPFLRGNIGYYTESEKFATELINFSKDYYLISNSKL